MRKEEPNEQDWKRRIFLKRDGLRARGARSFSVSLDRDKQARVGAAMKRHGILGQQGRSVGLSELLMKLVGDDEGRLSAPALDARIRELQARLDAAGIKGEAAPNGGTS